MLGPSAQTQVQQIKSKGAKSRYPMCVVSVCVFLLVSRCQAAECSSCPSSLSCRASPELCYEGWVLVETTCRFNNDMIDLILIHHQQKLQEKTNQKKRPVHGKVPMCTAGKKVKLNIQYQTPVTMTASVLISAFHKKQQQPPLSTHRHTQLQLCILS